MRKAAAAAEDSVWIKMVAQHLLRLGFLIVLAPTLGKAREVLPFPAQKWEEGVGRRGEERRGAAAFCSRQQCEAAVPCQTVSKPICGIALAWVKARLTCLGTSPALLNPCVASCPFHLGAMLLGA